MPQHDERVEVDWLSWLERHAPPVPEHAKPAVAGARHRRRRDALQRIAGKLGHWHKQGFQPWTDPETGERTHRWQAYQLPAITTLDQLCATSEDELAHERKLDQFSGDLALLAACLENAGRHLDEPAYVERPPPVDHAARNKAIVEAHAAGASMTELAKQHGVCRDRIHQIVRRHERRAKWRSTVTDGDLPELKLWLARQAVAVKGEDAAPSTRLMTALHNSGIDTVEELCARREIDLLRTPNFGRKSLGELREYLKADGRSLRSDEAPPPPRPEVALPPMPTLADLATPRASCSSLADWSDCES